MNILELLRLRRKLKPETFYEQLAKDGLLEEYLRKFFEDKFATDEVFRQEMFDILLKYSKKPVVEVEIYYLEKMIAALSYFLEYSDQWTKPEH